MHKEYECTILEIDTKFISKLENMGAKKIGEYFQKRYVYEFNPINENKWIRLRTNGIKTTLAIKEVINKNEIGGTNEIEIEVSDFENTNNILKELGYVARNYQENKRIKYLLDDDKKRILSSMYQSVDDVQIDSFNEISSRRWKIYE